MRIALWEIFERADLRAVDQRPEAMRPRNVTLAPARGTRVVLERQPRPSRTAGPTDVLSTKAG
jgi:hypothetical protein